MNNTCKSNNSHFNRKANFSQSGGFRGPNNGVWFVTEEKIYTLEEVKKIKRFLAKRWEMGTNLKRRVPVNEWMVVALALKTGLRVSEIAALNCGDISPGSRFPLLIVRNGKGGKSRIVEINGELAADVRWFIGWKNSIGESTADDAPLFVSGIRGRRYSTRGLEMLFKRTVTAAGIHKRNNIHMARHTYASHLVMTTGQDWAFVKNQLGHSSIEVTQVYVHVIRSKARKALARLYV